MNVRTKHAWALAAILVGCGEPASEGGCENDADCKGSRVCEQGECVDPGGAGASSGSMPGDCSACQLDALSCDAGGEPLVVTIDASTAQSCTGTIGGAEPIWIHCSTSTVCVEHEDECFAAELRPNGFSYTVPGKNVVVDCGG